MSEGNIDGQQYAYPHCNATVLHAPAMSQTVATLWAWPGETSATLSFHPIEQAPASLAQLSTSQAELVRQGIKPLVIPLTERAWRALVSLHQTQAKVFASGAAHETAPAIRLEGAPPASVRADETYQPISDELSWPRRNATALPLTEPGFARSGLAPALIAMPVSHGSSWSLITGTAEKGWTTEQLPSLRAVAASLGSGRRLRSVILYALTAIESGLTSEHWQQESARRSGACHYCDQFPKRQHAWAAKGMAFTPAEANGWSGNVAVKAGELHTHMGATFEVGSNPAPERPLVPTLKLRTRLGRAIAARLGYSTSVQ